MLSTCCICKMRKSIGAIKKASKILNRDTLLSLYQSLVLPYLNYCSLIWGNCAVTHLTRPFLLQKQVVRVIHGLPKREHTAPFFFRSSLLNVFDIYKLNCAVFIYKVLHGQLPLFVNDKFHHLIFSSVPNSDERTRSRDLLPGHSPGQPSVRSLLYFRSFT